MSLFIDSHWCIGGDFNVISDTKEKQGGKPYRIHRSLNFVNWPRIFGPEFTWRNNKRPRKMIWKRLDSICINNLWAQKFQNNSVRYLVRTGSDYRLLLIKSQEINHNNVKYFRFLNCRGKIPGFFDIVKEVWNTTIQENSIWRLQSKF